VDFFGPCPYGPGPNPMGWVKLTPLAKKVIMLASRNRVK